MPNIPLVGDLRLVPVGEFGYQEKRVGWLLLLSVTAGLTGTVMKMFEAELARAIELTGFIPLLTRPTADR